MYCYHNNLLYVYFVFTLFSYSYFAIQPSNYVYVWMYATHVEISVWSMHISCPEEKTYNNLIKWKTLKSLPIINEYKW